MSRQGEAEIGYLMFPVAQSLWVRTGVVEVWITPPHDDSQRFCQQPVAGAAVKIPVRLFVDRRRLCGDPSAQGLMTPMLRSLFESSSTLLTRFPDRKKLCPIAQQPVATSDDRCR